MKAVNPNAVIEFVNNSIDDEEDQWKNIRKYSSSDLRFGYAGALGHLNDIKEMKYDFSKVYTFGVKGMDYDEILKFDKLSEPRDIWNYGKLYKNFDVSLVPLSRNRFNWCKSDLKIAEAAWTRTAVIASNTKPYNGIIRHGETGLLCSTPQEWEEAIESIDKKTAKKMANNLFEDIKDHEDYNLDKINLKRLKHLV
jgi:glycosyltransferase involved in cell wall biosynthesis